LYTSEIFDAAYIDSQLLALLDSLSSPFQGSSSQRRIPASVTNYHSALRNIPEEWRSYLHHGGSLKSCTAICLIPLCLHGALRGDLYLKSVTKQKPFHVR